MYESRLPMAARIHSVATLCDALQFLEYHSSDTCRCLSCRSRACIFGTTPSGLSVRLTVSKHGTGEHRHSQWCVLQDEAMYEGKLCFEQASSCATYPTLTQRKGGRAVGGIG
jgi:hypothetical protein